MRYTRLYILFFLKQANPDSVQLQMDEKHLVDLSNLQSSMALSFKEKLQQVNVDLCLMPPFFL